VGPVPISPRSATSVPATQPGAGSGKPPSICSLHRSGGGWGCSDCLLYQPELVSDSSVHKKPVPAKAPVIDLSGGGFRDKRPLGKPWLRVYNHVVVTACSLGRKPKAAYLVAARREPSGMTVAARREPSGMTIGTPGGLRRSANKIPPWCKCYLLPSLRDYETGQFPPLGAWATVRSTPIKDQPGTPCKNSESRMALPITATVTIRQSFPLGPPITFVTPPWPCARARVLRRSYCDCDWRKPCKNRQRLRWQRLVRVSFC
jgi:hypothetical protein